MKLTHKIITAASMGLLGCTSSFADTTISAGLGVINDSNLLRQVESSSETAISVTPGIEFTRETGAQKYDIKYQGDFRQYTGNDDLDYNAHDLTLAADLRHSRRLSSNFAALYYNGIERAGITDQSTADFTQLTDFELRGLRALGSYGTRESTGQLVFAFAHNQRRYENNAQEFRDSDENEISARFFYRRNDVSRFLVETSYADVEYKNTELRNNESTDRTSFLVGLEWDLGAVTTGVAKVGWQSRSFDNDTFEDRSDLAYSLEMIWTPYQSTRISAEASRQVAAAAQVDSGDLIRNNFVLGARYELSERTILVGEFGYGVEDIAETRTDKRQRLSLGGDYYFRRWLRIEGRYFYDERSSDLDALEFDSNTLQLNVVVTLDR
ncbi:MAG: outer membrane beta-barrel protein [Pseudomonadota bacterium]